MTSRNLREPRRRAIPGPRWDEASLFPRHHGLAWWTAVLLAVGFAVVGAVADLERIDRLGVLFQGCYFLGCLLSVILVQRRALFGPVVAPPLILATAVPTVVVTAGGVPSGSGLAGTALAVLAPLINGFPTMAVTSLLTITLGAFRLATQRRPAGEPQHRTAPPRPSPRPRPPAGHTRQPGPVSRRPRSSA